MVRINDAFPSKYLSAKDLPPNAFVRVTIDTVVVEMMDESSGETKPIAYFMGKQKGMPINRTNAQVIAQQYGEETDDWAEKDILLYVTDVPFQGRLVPAIRVKIPGPRQPQAAAPPTTARRMPPAAPRVPAPHAPQNPPRRPAPAAAAPPAGEPHYEPEEPPAHAEDMPPSDFAPDVIPPEDDIPF